MIPVWLSTGLKTGGDTQRPLKVPTVRLTKHRRRKLKLTSTLRFIVVEQFRLELHDTDAVTTAECTSTHGAH